MSGFWTEIQGQLDRVAKDGDIFDRVRGVLLDFEAFPSVGKEVNRNGAMTFGEGEAFFAGSGGDDTLIEALLSAGWVFEWSKTSYWYGMRHPVIGDRLEYIEGDVYRR